MSADARPPRPSNFTHLAALRREGDTQYSTCSEANLGGQVFGGQLMAQALVAAADGLPPERRLRSLSASFLRAVPLLPLPGYRVRPLMDGRSFDFRSVEAMVGERPAFQAQLLFQAPETGADHQSEMPSVPGPESLPDLPALAQQHGARLSDGNARVLRDQQLYELRPVDGEDFIFCTRRQPAQRYWMKTSAPLPDDPRLHEAALAFLSDAWINSAMLLPHVGFRLARNFLAPTLSHQLWIHRELRADDWLLFDVKSPSLQGATGLVTADIFDRQGRLVASAAQHSLFRKAG